MLTKEQKLALELVFNSPLSGFTSWGGGTALSEIYLHHRQSDDIDIIMSELPDEFVLSDLTEKIRLKTKAKSKNSFARANRFQYVFELNRGQQKLEFVYYPFIKLSREKKVGQIKVESLRDIAVSKTLAAYQRNEVKDAFDLFVILKNKQFKLSDLVQDVEKKFDEKIDPAQLLAKLSKSLSQFSILEPMLIERYSKAEIADFFQKELDEFLKSAKM